MMTGLLLATGFAGGARAGDGTAGWLLPSAEPMSAWTGSVEAGGARYRAAWRRCYDSNACEQFEDAWVVGFLGGTAALGDRFAVGVRAGWFVDLDKPSRMDSGWVGLGGVRVVAYRNSWFGVAPWGLMSGVVEFPVGSLPTDEPFRQYQFVPGFAAWFDGGAWRGYVSVPVGGYILEAGDLGPDGSGGWWNWRFILLSETGAWRRLWPGSWLRMGLQSASVSLGWLLELGALSLNADIALGLPMAHGFDEAGTLLDLRVSWSF